MIIYNPLTLLFGFGFHSPSLLRVGLEKIFPSSILCVKDLKMLSSNLIERSTDLRTCVCVCVFVGVSSLFFLEKIRVGCMCACVSYLWTCNEIEIKVVSIIWPPLGSVLLCVCVCCPFLSRRNVRSYLNETSSFLLVLLKYLFQSHIESTHNLSQRIQL